MNGKYKSIKSLISRLLMNPLMSNINEADLAAYVGEGLKLIGGVPSYIDDSCILTIKDYKAKLPSNLLYIIQTAQKINKNYIPLRYATDTLHSQYHKVGSPDFNTAAAKGYSINNGNVYFDDKEAELLMVYKAIKVDEDGYPMIPDNIKFEKALENYVKQEHYRILWELGKIPDKVFYKVEQEYLFYVGSAQSASQAMTIDEAESFTNALSRMIMKPLQQQEFFTNHGNQEYLKPNRI